MTKQTYKVETLTEGRVGALLFGGSNQSTTKLEKLLNKMDAEGYGMHFMTKDKVRNMVFSSRERIIVTFKLK